MAAAQVQGGNVPKDDDANVMGDICMLQRNKSRCSAKFSGVFLLPNTDCCK